MEQTYTPTQVAHILDMHEQQKARHRDAQRAYYIRKQEERRAYARMYYMQNRTTILGRMAAQRQPLQQNQPA